MELYRLKRISFGVVLFVVLLVLGLSVFQAGKRQVRISDRGQYVWTGIDGTDHPLEFSHPVDVEGGTWLALGCHLLIRSDDTATVDPTETKKGDELVRQKRLIPSKDIYEIWVYVPLGNDTYSRLGYLPVEVRVN